jgi:hypothetical protein
MGQPADGIMVSLIAQDVHETLREDQLAVVLFVSPLQSIIAASVVAGHFDQSMFVIGAGAFGFM